MIRAMIFDLDGTLVQTEKLKALSYAKAAVELCPHALTETKVIDAFKEFVGLSRREVAEGLMRRFSLERQAETRMDDFGVSAPWQAYVQVRLRHYERMLADPKIILENRWPHNLAVLEEARRAMCKTGLATMSHCPEARLGAVDERWIVDDPDQVAQVVRRMIDERKADRTSMAEE